LWIIGCFWPPTSVSFLVVCVSLSTRLINEKIIITITISRSILLLAMRGVRGFQRVFGRRGCAWHHHIFRGTNFYFLDTFFID
jgi:hypothetical protein